MKGRTCLMYAFQHALPLDVIDMLLTHDASPTIEDNGGNNALYFIQPTEYECCFNVIPFMINFNTTLEKNFH
jgi:hypothetical protein